MPDLMYINNLARFINMFELLLRNFKPLEPFPEIPDNGPGPKYLIAYDKDTKTGYFGQTSITELFKVEDLEAVAAKTLPGTAINRGTTDLWCKYTFDGKIIYVPRQVVRNGVAWADLYSAGFVYGTDDNGKYPFTTNANWAVIPLTPVNQFRLVSRLDSNGERIYFKIRLIKSMLTDPDADTLDASRIKLSEYSQTVERTQPTTGIGGPWAELGLMLGTIGAMETRGTTGSGLEMYNLICNGNGSAYTRSFAGKNGLAGWLPVLEKMPKGYNPNPAITDSGPGPKDLLEYDKNNDTGYFGLVEQSDLFSFEDVDAVAKTPLTGTAVNRNASNKWIKAYYKGKVLFMPISCTREKVLWTDIYKAGLQYGTDDNGKFQPGGVGVNQYAPIIKVTPDGNSNLFKVRAIQGYGGNVLPAAAASFDNTIMADSEYWAIRYRLVGVTTNPGNLTPAPRTPWATLGSTQQYPFGVELTANNAQAVMFNDNSDWLRKTMQPIATSTFCSFYPVLELVSVTKP